MSDEASSSGLRVMLPTVLGRVDLQKSRQVLIDALAADEDVTLDLSAIDVPDTVSLQLMLTFARDLRQSGRSLEFTGICDSLNNAIALLDFERHLFADASRD